MTIIKKTNKGTGVCLSCRKLNVSIVQWYNPYTDKILLEKICKSCAKRELGSKNKKGWDECL